MITLDSIHMKMAIRLVKSEKSLCLGTDIPISVSGGGNLVEYQLSKHS